MVFICLLGESKFRDILLGGSSGINGTFRQDPSVSTTSDSLQEMAKKERQMSR